MPRITRSTTSAKNLDSFWNPSSTNTKGSSLFQSAKLSVAKSKISQQEYLVGKVLSHQVESKRHCVKYFVKWVGYPIPYNSWESSAALAKCHGLIDHYKRNLDGDLKFTQKVPLRKCRSTQTRIMAQAKSNTDKPIVIDLEPNLVQREPHRIFGATEINGQRYVAVQWSQGDFKADIMLEKEANAKWPQLVAQSYENCYKGIRVATLKKMLEKNGVNVETLQKMLEMEEVKKRNLKKLFDH